VVRERNAIAIANENENECPQACGGCDVHNWRMSELGRTWMVMLRDVSHAVHVAGHDLLMAALVLHAETGLVLGVSISGTAAEALAGAFDAALTNQAADLPPGPPACVVSLAEVLPEVRKAIAAASLSPQIIESGSSAEAEDIFDSLVGHMAGRAQPAEPPSTEDWWLLYDQARAYLRAEPWARWSDDVPLGLQLTLDGTTAKYVAVVMGNAGIQLGLALYPGVTLPPGLRSPGPEPGLETTPSGTLLLMLERPGDIPSEFAGKALRYGWPAGAAYVPGWVGVGSEGPSDLADADAHRLQMALAAVLAIDSRGPVLAESDMGTSGRVALADGSHGDFVITQ
jgi:hypothetical protein